MPHKDWGPKLGKTTLRRPEYTAPRGLQRPVKKAKRVEKSEKIVPLIDILEFIFELPKPRCPKGGPICHTWT